MDLNMVFELVLNTNQLDIQYGETEPSKKFPFLIGQTYKATLQAGSVIYYVEIKYNYSTNWLDYNIQDDSDNILQADSYLSEFPVNLLQLDDLLTYGLFFKNQTLVFGKLNPSWYKLSINKTDSTLQDLYQNARL